MMTKWNNERSKLEKYLKDGMTLTEISQLYGCTASNIKSVISRLGIGKSIGGRSQDRICKNCGKTFKKYSGSTGAFCCCQCSSDYKGRIGYQRLIDGDPSIMRADFSPYRYRKYILGEQSNCCAICGMSNVWNGRPINFIVDHIDGRASNNIRSNLRCICPNCDSQLDTYKSKNKHGERTYYKMTKP